MQNRSTFLLALMGILSLAGNVTAQPAVVPRSTGAATAKQAAAVLDLSKFPLYRPDGEANARVIASQSYSAQGSVKEVADAIGRALGKSGFKTLEGATVTEDYANAQYTKEGFIVNLSVFPGSKPGVVSVALNNQGNVDLKQLPVPAGSKQLYAFPSMVSYETGLSAADATKECLRLLQGAGWERFGETTASFFVKSNAVKVQVSVTEMPGQEGKSSIQFTCEQMSADLPAPPDVVFLQYSDSTGNMLLDSPKPQEELVQYFKASLGKSGWKATTENPVRIKFRDHLIFRNDAKEYIEIEFYQVDANTRASLKYQTAEQFAALEKKAEEQIASAVQKKQMAENAKPPVLAIKTPANAKVTERNAQSLEFAIASGKAKAAVDQWLVVMQADGWNKETQVDTKDASHHDLTKGSVKITVTHIDPGFIPGSITITALGNVQLQETK